MPIGTLYQDLGITLKEDVLDLLAQITPTDTPFFSMIGDGSADNVFHQWLKRELTTRQVNGQPEGDAYAFTVEPAASSRELNVTQIFKKQVRVSRSSQRSARYAIADQFADQMELRMMEFKTDMEHALIRGSLASGNASVARFLRGLLWAATLGSNVTRKTTASFNETDLNDLLQRGWDLGVKGRDVLVNGVLKRRISGFTASSTKFRDQNERKLVNSISTYDSDFGVIDIALSRDIPQNVAVASGYVQQVVVMFDRAMFKKAWLDRPFTERVPKTADSLDGVVIGEVTLEYGHPSGAGVIIADERTT